MYGSPTDVEESEPSHLEYINLLKERLKEVNDLASVASDLLKVRFNPKAKPMSFEEGDSVWF